MLQQQERDALPAYALERLSRSGKPETFGSIEDKWRLLVILFGRQNQARKTALRDIHTLLDPGNSGARPRLRSDCPFSSARSPLYERLPESGCR